MSGFNYGRKGFNTDVIILAIPISILFFLMGGPVGFILTWVVAIFLILKSEHYNSYNVYATKNLLKYNNYKIKGKHSIAPKYCRSDLTPTERKYIDACLTAAEHYKMLYKKPITAEVYASIMRTLEFPYKNNYSSYLSIESYEIYRMIHAPEGMKKFEAIEKGYPKKELLVKFM